MKTYKLICSLAALVAVGSTACKDSEPAPQAAVPEIRGEAIASLAPAAEQAEPAIVKPTGVKPDPETPVATTQVVAPVPAVSDPDPSVDPVKPSPPADPVKVAKATAAALTTELAEVSTGVPTIVSDPKASPPPVSPTPAPAKPAPVEPKRKDLTGTDETEEPKPVAGPKTAQTEKVKEVIEMDGDYRVVGFEKLASFEFEVPEEEYDPDKKPEPAKAPDQIPADVKALDKKSVAVKGFMLPLKVEDGEITELLIMRDQSMCCYGTVPKINEWVSVKMISKGVKPILDQSVTIYGKLKVGEMRENGYLIGIYEMDGEKMTGPLDF
jgi:hypothetical protein